MSYCLNLPLSLGGDEPTWEGEVRVQYDVNWAEAASFDCPATDSEVSWIRILLVDGVAPSKYEADLFEDHIWCNNALLDYLVEHAQEEECYFADEAADAAREARYEDRRGGFF